MIIRIKQENGQRNVYKDGAFIASIVDHRQSPKIGTITDNWMVAWKTGRVDWHGSLSDARDNVLKA